MRRCLVLLACALVGTPSTWAWDDFGHMTVAAIAYKQLTPAARAKSNALLKLNPQSAEWVNGVAKKDRAITAFMKAATWPDAIKGMPGYTNDHDVSSPTASQNVGYSDKLQHRYWHFVDVPFSPDGTPTTEAVPPNAQTRIGDFKKLLASADAEDSLKSYDLVWVLHLVGDVHQPLHATSRFTTTQLKGDRGGNDVAVCPTANPCKGELHAFWDDVLGKSKSPTTARKAANIIAPVTPPPGTETDESTWVKESFEKAQTAVYVSPPIEVGAGPFTLTEAYRLAARATAKERVALAGARLAAVLNEAFQ